MKLRVLAYLDSSRMTFIKYEINFNEEELKGKTLVLPTISMANVPQLATELLLNNHSNELVGRFNNEGFIQVAGASTDGLVTPLELHRLKEYSDVYVVDQRSPILKVRGGSPAEIANKCRATSIPS